MGRIPRAVVTLVVLVGGACAGARSAGLDPAAPEVRFVLGEYDRAVGRKDQRALLGLLAEDFVRVSTEGEVGGIDPFFQEVFSRDYRLESVERDQVAIRRTDDTAVVTSRWIADGRRDGAPFHAQLRCTLVLQRGEGSWLVRAEHCSPLADG